MQEQEPLQADGHVLITIDGVDYDCRRPNAGEYLMLMGESAKMVDALKAKKEEMPDNTFEQNKLAMELASEWFRLMLKTLANPPFEGVAADIPPWAVSNFSNEILGHWISRPLAHRGDS